MPTPPPILVGDIGEYVWLRVNGRGSFQCSPQIKELVTRLIVRGRVHFVIDLADCPVMDSTFMGTLTGITLSLTAHKGSHLLILNANERNLSLLSNLGLDQILDIDKEGTALPELRRKVDQAMLPAHEEASPISEEERKAHILEAHETLSETSEANRERFQDVVSFLKTEIQQDSGTL